MKIAHAVLVVAAVGAAQMAPRQLHQRQRNEVAVARLQHDWLTHLTRHPDLAKQWIPEGMDMGEEEFVQLLNANQQACALGLRNRLGLARGERLAFMAETFMKQEVGRRYWKAFGGYRQDESVGDGWARRFNRCMDDACVAHLETDPVGV
ncbi:DUF6082 family protein [Streptomyces rhizosphaericus]|uniref:DUF6082 family protein n=1 Tax=Streptomyces rhizosphaericus TaxID=114699 RepID=UPI000A3AF93F|nr:DUF6082 family protein [Streptomyces rhizosphaericus]